MTDGTQLMAMMRIHMTFEQGPIRPPSESRSLLLRFTRNCSWNHCTFCPIYKGQKFSRRSLTEITRDIEAVRAIVDDVGDLSRSMGSGDELTREVLDEVLTRPGYNSCHRHVAVWRFFGQGTVFIQDANSLVLPTRDLVSALRYLKEKVPGIQRVTSYARSSTVARKTIEELLEIREAGLDRIHIGLESGSDQVLAMVKKGATAGQHIEAGRKVIEAGMTLSEYIMPGLGGAAWSRQHALETARVLNAIDPHYIRLRTLHVPTHAALHQDLVHGRFQLLGDDQVVEEIRLLVESLDGIHSTLSSDHIMNLLEDVAGVFPEDRQRMLAVMDRYLALPAEERLLFRLGRRGGALRSLDELQDPVLRSRLQQAMRDLAAPAGGDLESVITELGNQYI
jgi:histone acetyltransferase (RNA polymerase elongator complex component)